MDTRLIEYKHGTPFYPVNFPPNEAEGILIEDIQLDYLINLINSQNIKSAYICNLCDFSFLNNTKSLEHLSFEFKVLPKYYSRLKQSKSKYIMEYDITPVYKLERLKSLSVIDLEQPNITTKIKFDLGGFQHLEKFSGDNKFITNIGCAKKLRTLRLNSYSNSSLKELACLSNLDSLELNSSRVVSLEGIEDLNNLQCLYLYNNRSLENVEMLKHTKKLKALRIENSSKIMNFDFIKKLENLELLELSGSNSINNLDFIKELPNLQTFIFNINVEDGNLSPCMSLNYVYSERNRKHYNIKDSKLPKNKYLRGNEDIELWRRLE